MRDQIKSILNELDEYDIYGFLFTFSAIPNLDPISADDFVDEIKESACLKNALEWVINKSKSSFNPRFLDYE